MNRDDDSFLSAYLDGELDSQERTMVESALVSDPELAEKLRGISSLRDLLSSLNRDRPADVTQRVMGQIQLKRIATARLRRRQLWLRAIKLSPRAALAAGVAATLLLALSLTLPFLRYRLSQRPNQALATHNLAPARSVPGNMPGSESDRSARDFEPGRAVAGVKAATAGALGVSPRDAARGTLAGHSAGASRPSRVGTHDHYRQLLDNPNPSRIFRVRDAGDGKRSEQVASVVASATQFGFYKVTIAQGIVIDPRHPGEATVYAALVSAKGLDALRDRLAREVPDRVEESQVEPAVVTLLADIGQVQGVRSAPFGDVKIPDAAGLLAFQRVSPGDEQDEMESGDDSNPPVDGQPTIEQKRSAPIGDQILNRLTFGPSNARKSAAGGEAGAAAVAGAPLDRGTPAEPSRDSALPTQPAAAQVARRQTPLEDTFVVFVWVERSHRG